MESFTNQINHYSFEQLVKNISNIDSQAQTSAIKAVNQFATLRNWLIGKYIVEYEQFGNDRAKYGEKLIERLSTSLKDKRLNSTLLKNSRSFYITYPHIGSYFKKGLTASDFFGMLNTSQQQSLISIANTMPSKSPTTSDNYIMPAETLIHNLSFSHFVELLTINDPMIRFFYESECIKGTWSVRELRRQITSNLHIRIGISDKKQFILSQTNSTAIAQSNALQIRDPYTFEFIGLQSKDLCSENELEDALILHLQEFLLELGKGFCFEARQKRIIIDGEYYFADLVFYNRLLHCNVIVELKNDEFRHEHIGQLNAYVSYYAENEMQPGDNPPIGILLCTRKGKKMVEYALGNLDNRIFVSTYQLQLPNRSQLEQFIMNECE